jgi:cation diffusion facilitator family transporter
LALVADGLHMSTHAAAMLIAAAAYTYARRHADNPAFAFGTGKIGDLAGFSSAIILMMVALLIGYEAVSRIIDPVEIQYREAIGIAALGLLVNIASAWLLSGDHHHHDHAHDDHTHKDHNIRAAFFHVVGDGAVSVLAIFGLLLARNFGWRFMDPLMGVAGMAVILRWSIGLLRDTGAILLDKTADSGLALRIAELLQSDGDRLTDMHVWRLGPGHLGLILSVTTQKDRDAVYYHRQLARFSSLSHVTIEVVTAK